MAIKDGDFIKLSYSGSVDENIFDTTDDAEAKSAGIHSPNAIYGPVTICVGQKHVILGLDEELVGKEVGAEGDVVVTPEKAFGERDPKRIKSFPKNQFKEKPVRGMPVKMDELGKARLLMSSVPRSLSISMPRLRDRPCRTTILLKRTLPIRSTSSKGWSGCMPAETWRSRWMTVRQPSRSPRALTMTAAGFSGEAGSSTRGLS